MLFFPHHWDLKVHKYNPLEYLKRYYLMLYVNQIFLKQNQ